MFTSPLDFRRMVCFETCHLESSFTHCPVRSGPHRGSGSTTAYHVRFVECKTTVTAADGRTFVAIGRRDADVTIPNGNVHTTVKLQDALYTPEMRSTLISVPRLDRNGFSALFRSGECKIIAPNGQTIGRIPLSDGLYQTTRETVQSALVKAHAVTIDKAHRLLGHISHQTIRNGIRNGKISGLTITNLDNSSESFCEICAPSKPTRKPFPHEATNRAKELGGRIHADLWGPAQVVSLSGTRYTIDFTDDATRYTHIDFLKTKDEALKAYQKLNNVLETQFGARIKIFHTDRGSELNNKTTDEYLAKQGTKRELTVHHTPAQNGVAERFNQTKVEITRSLLIESGLPRFLWPEAMSHATWIKNRVPTQALNGISPFEAIHGKAPDLSMLLPFGTHTWVKDIKAGKLDRRSKHGRFVGFDLDSRGYQIYFEAERRVNVEREVLFDYDRPLVDAQIQIEVEAPMKTIEAPKAVNEQEIENAPATSRSLKTKVVPKTIDGLIEADPMKGRRMRARLVVGHFENVNEGRAAAALVSECDEELSKIEFAYLALPGDEPETIEEALTCLLLLLEHLKDSTGHVTLTCDHVTSPVVTYCHLLAPACHLLAPGTSHLLNPSSVPAIVKGIYIGFSHSRTTQILNSVMRFGFRFENTLGMTKFSVAVALVHQ